MGLTARVGVEMGPAVAVESDKEVFEMEMTVGVLAGMSMTEGDQQFLPLFLTSDLPVSLWRRESLILTWLRTTVATCTVNNTFCFVVLDKLYQWRIQGGFVGFGRTPLPCSIDYCYDKKKIKI